MKNTAHLNVAIVILALSATFMLGLLAGRLQDTPALATTAMSSGGGYVMTSGQANRSNDVLYVIDTRTNRMNAYAASRRGQGYNLVLLATRDLGQLVTAARQTPQEAEK